MRNTSLFALLLLCSFLLAEEPVAKRGPFDAKLLEVAANYKKFRRVDDQLYLAPELCRSENFSIPRLSASTDEKTHGRKLYYLFSRLRDEYWSAEKHPAQPVDQVIVKEAWSAKETTDPKYEDPHSEIDGKSLAHNGKLLAPGEKTGLFIMLKLDPKTEGTDQGWVYGTVSADGKTVTGAGRIASCMKCHEEAKYDRLFGVTRKSDTAYPARLR